MSDSTCRPGEGRLPRIVAALFRALLPIAEREEVLADLEAEYVRRSGTSGPRAAKRWAWQQAVGSAPALLRRTWWRGMTGFEPRANRLRPGGPMLESWIMDFRYAARRLMARPTYALLAVLTLALGAGGTAAIFSVVRSLLLEPLPIAREHQVGVFWMPYSWNEAEFLHMRGRFQGFEQVAAFRQNDLTLEVPDAPMRLLPGMAGSSELFDVLGAQPMLGRTFSAGEDVPGAELVAVLSHALWQELGADPNIIGKPLQLGGFSRTVIGVMPRGFWFPSPKTRIWTAAQMTPQSMSGRYTLVGRVVQDMSLDALEGPLASITAALGERFQYPNPQWDLTRNPKVTPARDYFVGDVRPALLATLAAMAVILLIACANVAALMLGQMDARATEIAVRAALGANRQRLIQQLTLESVLVGILAGVAGAALAVLGFQVMVQSLPLGALAETARLDWTVFWASMLAALVAAVLVAIVPGITLWRGSSLQSTMATTRTGGVARRGGRLEGGLVVVQMALAVLLAAGAGLLIRSVANLRAIDPGVDVERLVLVEATMPTRLPPDDRRRAILDMLPHLQALPGVSAVAAAQRIPLLHRGDNWGISIQGRPNTEQATTAFRMVTRDYFRTMGMPVTRGRDFTPSDREGSERVVVINEALAAKFFPGEDPIGRVLLTFGEPGERIIGVVGNATEAALTDPPAPARYMLYEHVPPVWYQVTFVLRTNDAGRMPALLELARSTVAREGRQLAVQQTTTMQNVFDLAIGPAGQVVTLLALLAGLALVLGAVGVYGVISHYVTRRSRDYGIRLALGQPPAGVIRQVVGRGAALVAVGSAIGVAAALALTQLLASLLYGIEATDPLAMAAAVAVLLVVGMLAAFVPARRASLTDPAVVLRQP
ncbi:MAG TPA: ADOP family duplicated permease [Vicinamibacterales bacterium]|nr:ADOP family duplicated permease [Vicinamibacterales bacterium]